MRKKQEKTENIQFKMQNTFLISVITLCMHNEQAVVACLLFFSPSLSICTSCTRIRTQTHTHEYICNEPPLPLPTPDDLCLFSHTNKHTYTQTSAIKFIETKQTKKKKINMLPPKSRTVHRFEEKQNLNDWGILQTCLKLTTNINGAFIGTLMRSKLMRSEVINRLIYILLKFNESVLCSSQQNCIHSLQARRFNLLKRCAPDVWHEQPSGSSKKQCTIFFEINAKKVSVKIIFISFLNIKRIFTFRLYCICKMRLYSKFV